MQTSKFLLGIGAAIVLCAPIHALAKPDTEEQAKMREALRLKMEELSVQETPPAPVVEAPAPVVVVPKPEPKPVAKPAAPKPVKPKQEESKAKTVVVPVPMETPVAAPAKTKFSDPDVIESEAAADARMREALQQKMSELNKKPAVAVESPAPVAKSQPKAVVAPAKPVAPVAPVVPAATVVVAAPKPTQIEAPVSSPVPVTKQGRLAELLRRYKADEMTAQDYHSQRAAILAESAAK